MEPIFKVIDKNSHLPNDLQTQLHIWINGVENLDSQTHKPSHKNSFKMRFKQIQYQVRVKAKAFVKS